MKYTMRTFHDDNARKRMYRTTRAARRSLVHDFQLDVEEARRIFFAQLLHVCARGLTGGLNSELTTEISLEAALSQVTELTSAQMDIETSPWMSAAQLIEFRDLLASDPLLIGWAYQFWNQEERDASTYAVLRKGMLREGEASFAFATQLFTEHYMVEHVARRCLSLVSSQDSLDVFDPACGVGHFLVGALRVALSSGHSTEVPAEKIADVVAGLHGCDIDPFAVVLCRGIILLEAVRLGGQDMERLSGTLCATIQSVQLPHGTLDRGSPCKLLQRQYQCVLTNPPYVGRRKLTTEVRKFLDQHYPDTSMDLCSAFMERCVELVAPGGSLGLVTVDKWLRLKGYDRLRRGGAHFSGLYNSLALDCICDLGRRAFHPLADLHDGVGVVLLTATRKAPTSEHSFQYLSCVSGRGLIEKAHELQARMGVEGGKTPIEEVLQRDLCAGDSSGDFLMSGQLPAKLIQSPTCVRDVANVVVGLQTSDDRRFVRYHWSVPPDRTRYRIHSKGGGYGRWFGFNRFVLDWGIGEPLFRGDPKSGVGAEEWFDKPGWTYTWFANGSLGLRIKEAGWSFGRAAASGIFTQDDRVIGFLNSRLGSVAARCIGGKAQLPEGIVRKLPMPESLDAIDGELVRAAVRLKQEIVRMDPTEVTFSADRIRDPLECLRIQAILLLIEGELESQAFAAAQATKQERTQIASLIAAPVAWYRQESRGRDDALWNSATEAVRTRLSYPGECILPGESQPNVKERIESYLTGAQSSLPAQIGFPVMLPLEAMCRACSVNPADAWLGIRDLFSTSSIARRAFGRKIAQVEILESVLELLGHRWWSDPRPWTGTSAEVSASDVIDVALQIRSAKDWHDLLGDSLEEWVSRHLLTWQEKLFFKQPPVRKGARNSSFVHVWGDEEKTQLLPVIHS